jgi:uncharacterized membrane protein YqhA
MIFWGGVFMVVLSFAVFVMFVDPINNKREWLEDTCAAVMMMGLGIAILGALTWIGRYI